LRTHLNINSIKIMATKIVKTKKKKAEKKIAVPCYLDKEQNSKLKEICSKTLRSKNAVINLALNDYFSANLETIRATYK